MRLYLSSYRLGDHSDQLIRLVGKPDAEVAVIDNALDFSDDLARRNIQLDVEMGDMRSLGFKPTHIDLRDYFQRQDDLVDAMEHFDAVWIRGGNSFILRKAMHQSGFDQVVAKLIKPGQLVYAGYSAAVAVLSPSLRGVELVDDVAATADGYMSETVWDGYGLIDFYPIVHYQSDHPESSLVDRELDHIKSLGIAYRTMRDGEVIVIED